jgi:hypothetical protein
VTSARRRAQRQAPRFNAAEEETIDMIVRRHSGIAALLTLAALFLIGDQAYPAQPIRFTFTPTFKDPDPGKRQWEQKGDKYVETLPSGRVNTFRVQKQGTVNQLKGTILQKIEEPNFYVFIADSESKRKELWWWRDKGPWKFMGIMKDISVPGKFD